MSLAGVCVLALAVSLPVASAQVFFGDSDRSGYYDSGLAFRTAPSALAQAGPSGDKIPVTDTALVGDDALRLAWTSRPGGDWSALVIAPGFPFLDLSTADSLGFWVYSLEVLAAADLPDVFLEGDPGAMKSARYALGDFLAGDLAAATWTRMSIPLATLREDPANAGLQFDRIKAVIFGQGAADGAPHTLFVDQVEGFSAGAVTGDSPAELRATGYGRHVELAWDAPADQPAYYAIYREGAGEREELVRLVPGADTLALDWPVDAAADNTYTYRIAATTSSAAAASGGPIATASLREQSDDDLYDMTQEYTLRYFWDFAHPVSGLARERNTTDNTVTSGGSGFGLMAWAVGVERGWLERDAVVARLNGTLAFLEGADRFHGAWPHWLDGRTGEVIPFSELDDGGDLVETAFLAQALLTVRQYFDADTPAEDSVRARATRLWEGIEWDWYVQPGEDVVTWHWSPQNAFAIDLAVRGFNETQIVYLLGIASPTHPLPASLYESGWVGDSYVNTSSRYGITIPVGEPSGGPMFFAHYSYQGFDPRYWRDAYANYFERNRLHAEVQIAYAEANPLNYEGYAAEAWGFTASDDPEQGYAVHAADQSRDNGTLTPTAALSSMPYTPAASTAALRTFYEDYGRSVFGELGFRDAFNPTLGWYADSYLAIDQGPIINMIENHRSGLLWRNFMANPEIAPALVAAGFTPDSTTVATDDVRPVFAEAALELWPNPYVGAGALTVRVPPAFALTRDVTLDLVDPLGRRVVGLRQNLSPAADGTLALALPNLAPGLYRIILRQAAQAASAPLLISSTP